ncbi:uncharacterized protein E0L32_009971 [Thyridium curvatum]|uniref:EthD domain-containing protein n=1 Tax=Thyridium curvatum TaxID=1093900 RepID=A0A507AHR7_9PEZI|nr:uncharacterized protein E0L32_009971 [Thyridium curvatum]TPX08632.1 hypothetical protein E0L32_009971 [Thyridium curvatum]
MSIDRAVGHERISHKFTYDTLSYDAGVHYQPCVKVSFYFKKLPDVSYDHFHQHWATVHADLTVGSKPFARHKVLRYIQHHQSPEDKERAKKYGSVMDYDGCSTLWLASWEDFDQFINSPEYAALSSDCDHFLDVSSITLFAGHDMIAFGKATPGIEDSDGVTEYASGG